ncbi:MAG TPA: helicase C-terminal domain-containing protein [Myxococcota bacterium]|nr:helicase C-terminal domain-containing protein [Myxococcota bacterium]
MSETAGAVLDAEVLSAMLRTGGAVSRVLPGYEERPGQVQMLESVVEAFNGDGILAVEAGTGVGKSLAYGLPAAAWAVSSGEKVVISSATINLQEQLVRKDLPLVGEVLSDQLDVVLVKGRGNYICRRRIGELASQRMLAYRNGTSATFQELSEWVDSTADGSRADLPVALDDRVWEQVASDQDACLGQRCQFRRECFFIRARRAADTADLLVVNHHLLFADLALRCQTDNWTRRAVLPAYRRLVLDEAQGLEDAASSFFGLRLTRAGVARILSRMLPYRKKAGLLQSLAVEIRERGGALVDGRAELMAGGARDSITPLVKNAREEYERAFDEAGALALGLGAQGGGDARLRLLEAVYTQPGWTAVRESFSKAARSARDLANRVEQLVRRLDILSEDEGRSVEVMAWVERTRLLAEQTMQLMSEEPDGAVRWVEAGRRGRRRIALRSAPLNVAGLLNESLFDRLSSVVLTSATLSVGDSFDYLAERIGMNLQPEARVRTRQVPSPFDYPSQARLVLPVDLPAPGGPLFEQHLPRAVCQAAAVSGGRALVLFTSWGLMTRIYDMIRDRLEEMGLQTFCQGEQPRDRLLGLFRENERSVLFGTDSFWQGVDVMGSSLCNVIITRLPFDVPDEPLVQARMEEIERVGRSSFAHFMLPRAVLKLKQGFGRLIRSRTDFGSVVVLDNRLLQRAYGRRFLESLPQAGLISGQMEDAFDELAAFFTKHGTLGAERVESYDW